MDVPIPNSTPTATPASSNQPVRTRPPRVRKPRPPPSSSSNSTTTTAAASMEGSTTSDLVNGTSTRGGRGGRTRGGGGEGSGRGRNGGRRGGRGGATNSVSGNGDHSISENGSMNRSTSSNGLEGDSNTNNNNSSNLPSTSNNQSASANSNSSSNGVPNRPNNNSNRPPRNNNNSNSNPTSRRSRFNPSLTSSNSTLTASAPSFHPPTSSHSTLPLPSPSPVTETLISRLTKELTNESYDCSICFSNLTKSTSIHSCDTCFTSFHLNCLGKWASRSIIESTERATLLAARAAASGSSGFNTPVGTGEIVEGGTWSCPGCQTRKKEVPNRYYCFCKRLQNPPLRLPIMPHSCGLQCKKTRPKGCGHGCGLLCHPGPCPPCSVVLTLPCHCNKQQLPIRCSSLYTSNSTLTPSPSLSTSSSDLLSCKQKCNKLLSCELHFCSSICHEGPCDPCTEIRGKKCFCGKEERKESCGSEGSDSRVICFKPTLSGTTVTGGGDEMWEGEWSCEKLCDAPFDCSHHSCRLPCHPHSTPLPLPCPFSPSTLSTCPCTSTPLSLLLSTPRSKCTDPIPLCAQRCPKLLDCGHKCGKKCHLGDCGKCESEIGTVCRCGNLKGSRQCGDRQKDGKTLLEEVLCEKICRALRNCGRHECLTKCCPLSYQEASRFKAKGKQRRTGLLDLSELENDPMGIHKCDRVCGRKLNCKSGHLCQLKDHKGVCPPCLDAGFEELVCHCGSTILLPPIPCGTTINCLHPCIRRNTCGHPTTPHACHEELECPPCPFLTEKQCACGKKKIGNVRCWQDVRKVNCGLICGKLLRCGFHTCRKTCHSSGECEGCDQICLKPLRLCQHPCPQNCHAPSPCSSELPCPMTIEVTCICSHIKQRVKCAVSESKPEGNKDKIVKCTDACLVNKRNLALAEALGIEKKEPKVKEVEYDPIIMSFYSNNINWCTAMETSLTEFVKGDKPALHLPIMKHPQRQFTHELAELYDLRSESLDEEPRRSVMAHRQSNSGIPTPTLAEAAAQRKTSSILTFSSLKKALPERLPSNAIFLEGVLGCTEEMLRDILRPLLRGLVFAVRWVAEEDVIITFESSINDLETKISSIQYSLRTLSEETGFCSSIESVHSSADGSIKRNAWTPIASSSRTPRAQSGVGLFTPNAFAALDKVPIVRPTPVAGVYKPPHLLKTESSSSSSTEDRYTAIAPPIEMEEKDLSNVPESWEEVDDEDIA